MTARVIDGKAVAAKLREEYKARIAALQEKHRLTPGLAVVLVGENPASQVYVRNKIRDCAEVGIRSEFIKLPESVTQEGLLAQIDELNGDDGIHGILIQLPLPAGIDARRVLFAVDPRKDVDGIHPENVGRLLMGEPRFVACTPFGVMKLIEEARLPLAGANAVVVGRSNMVGKPMAALLLGADATVTVCHSKTRDLAATVGRADLLVAAVGRPEMVRGEWVKPGAVVIDVGINRTAEGKLLGDVEYAAAAARASAITPVPGGVGPMTIAMLLANTVTAAKLRAAR